VPEIEQLEEQLSGLGGHMSWPSAPDLSGRVGARLAEPDQVRRPWYLSRLALAAALAILALAALIAYTPSREVIANWLNLHTIITRVNTLPSLSPRPPGPLGQRLGLGSQSTLEDAQRAIKYHVLVPASLGRPDEVYLQQPPDGPPDGEVTLVYGSRPGIKTSGETGVAVLITEARGRVENQYFQKMLGPDTTLEEVSVNGHAGYWISGAPHQFVFLDSAGLIRSETMRLATNTLLIDEGGTIVRIEGNLTKAQALTMAASLA
jgi:hypothetical protein